jgi:hypothetical protein
MPAVVGIMSAVVTSVIGSPVVSSVAGIIFVVVVAVSQS